MHTFCGEIPCVPGAVIRNTCQIVYLVLFGYYRIFESCPQWCYEGCPFTVRRKEWVGASNFSNLNLASSDLLLGYLILFLCSKEQSLPAGSCSFRADCKQLTCVLSCSSYPFKFSTSPHKDWTRSGADCILCDFAVCC